MKRSKVGSTGGFLTVARFTKAVDELNAAIVRKGLSDTAAWTRVVSALETKIEALESRVVELERGPR